MGMVAAIAAFEAQLTTVLTAIADPAQPVPKFRFGADQLRVEGKPPQITWVPTDGQIDGKIVPAPDTRLVANPKDPAQAPGAAIVAPRPLRVRRPVIETHIWAHGGDTADRRKDYTAAEVLLNHLVAAIHATAYGSYATLRESWRQSQDASSRFGIEVVLSIEIHIPITREPDTYAVVAAMPITPQIVQPS